MQRKCFCLLFLILILVANITALDLDEGAPPFAPNVRHEVGLLIIKELDRCQLKVPNPCDELTVYVRDKLCGEHKLPILGKVLEELHALCEIIPVLADYGVLLAPPVGRHGEGLAHVVHYGTLDDELGDVGGEEVVGHGAVKDGVFCGPQEGRVKGRAYVIHNELFVVRVRNNKPGLKVDRVRAD